jgi:hypothetical protein
MEVCETGVGSHHACDPLAFVDSDRTVAVLGEPLGGVLGADAELAGEDLGSGRGRCQTDYRA